MRVKTDHQIVAFGNNLMALCDTTGTQIVIATRTETGWQVAETTVESRGEAITALVDTALAVLPGDGYSCLVPRGLRDQP